MLSSDLKRGALKGIMHETVMTLCTLVTLGVDENVKRIMIQYKKTASPSASGGAGAWESPST